MERARQQQIQAIAQTLEAAGVLSAMWDAKQLVDHALPAGQPVTAEQTAVLAAWTTQRAKRIPLQHILGYTGFRLITVACAPGVFIPRPETEILVELVLTEVASQTAPRIVEPCTGTGAITASILAEREQVHLCATDSNAAAVALAQSNITRVIAGEAGVAKRSKNATADVYHGSLFDPIPPVWLGRTDVIVCNPPYLPRAAHRDLPAEVRDHDPYDALVGGDDGHELVSDIFSAATRWLRPDGMVAVEVDVTRGDDACDRALAAGLIAVRTHPDLTGAHRFVTARQAS